MRLTDETTVATPPERTWAAVGDLLQHGLRLDGEVAGTSFRGTARLEGADEDARVVTIAIAAREAGGSGVVAAAVEMELSAAGDGATRLAAEADVKLSGGVAQLGDEALRAQAGRLLGDFARRLEQHTPSAAPAEEPAAAAAEAAPGPPSTDDAAGAAPDLAALLRAVFAKQGAAGVASVLVLLLVMSLAGRRRSFRRGIELRYEW